ncbi:hypothetical protein [Azospirillum sp. SYSU D00513]|uniref:hypothetical protein n=1 Tax=Azospirillum sp. SYSU D00513 TaxID=2812561 RepID=UPI001A969B65|nr:hypothetical protein [Azospirillum sp. SYSU D00513]
MRALTAEGQDRVAEIARRHGVSMEAAEAMLDALSRGGGTMAQFNHPEFGGAGQWMMGGMTMVSDLFNNALKARVDGICNDLAALTGDPSVTLWQPPVQAQNQGQSYGQGQGGAGGYSLSGSWSASGNWWPGDLGSPTVTGSQNDLRYAYFPGSRRLAVDIGGNVTLYDTGDHLISGVGQQQGSGGWTLTFTSQFGTVPLSSLRIVVPADTAPPAPEPAFVPEPPAVPAAPDFASEAPAELAVTEAALAGSRWTLEPTEGAPFGTLTLEADTSLSGGAHPRMRYWSAENGVLSLYDANGRPSARFDRMLREQGAAVLSGSDPATGTGYLLRSQAASAASVEPLSGGTTLTGPLEVTGTWQLEGSGGAALATLRLLPGGGIEGGRPSEATWRIAGDALLLCHAGGRPTSRFDGFQYRAGLWSLTGCLTSDESVTLTLRQP